jgi:hypothetical protein
MLGFLKAAWQSKHLPDEVNRAMAISPARESVVDLLARFIAAGSIPIELLPVGPRP